MTNSFEVLELLEELNVELSKKNFEKVIEFMEILKAKLDFTIEENFVLMETMKVIVDYRTNSINSDKMRELSLELLNKTYNSKDNKFIRIPMRNEILLLNRVCISLSKLEMWIDAIEISEKLLKLYEDSKVSFIHHYRTSGLMKSNLAIYYEKQKQMEKALIQSYEGVKCELVSGNGGAIRTYIIRLAINGIYETQEEQVTMFRRGYDISELFFHEHGKSEAEYFCKSILGVMLI